MSKVDISANKQASSIKTQKTNRYHERHTQLRYFRLYEYKHFLYMSVTGGSTQATLVFVDTGNFYLMLIQ